jgi:hypothetical protein
MNQMSLKFTASAAGGCDFSCTRSVPFVVAIAAACRQQKFYNEREVIKVILMSKNVNSSHAVSFSLLSF